MKKPVFAGLLLCLLCLLTFGEAEAADKHKDLFNNVLTAYQDAASDWAEKITSAASWLFWSLVTISMVWTFGMMALRKADLAEFFAELVRFTIFTGFFWWLLDNAPDIATAIYDSLKKLAGQAGDIAGELKPSGIVDNGFAVFFKAVGNISAWSPIDSFFGVGMSIGVLIISALIAVNMLLLLISGWVLAYAGIFFLGFGGARWTSDIAINYYKTVLGIAAQLMIMVLLVGIGRSIIDGQYNNTDIKSVYQLGILLISTLVLFILVNRVPPLVAGIITGASVGSQGIGQFGAGAAMGAAMAAASTAGAAISAGASNVAGGVQAVMAAVSQASQNVDSGNDIMSSLGGASGGASESSDGGGGGSESSGDGAGDSPFAEAAGYGGSGSPSSDSAESSGGAGNNESSGGGGGNSESSGGGDSPSSGSAESSGGAGNDESAGGGGDSSESSGGGDKSSGNDSRASESSFLGAAARAGRVAADAGVMLSKGVVDVARQGLSNMQEGAKDQVAQSTMGKIAESIKRGAGKSAGGETLSAAAKAEVAAFVSRPPARGRGLKRGAGMN